MLESKSLSHQGLVRERNEDSLINNDSLGLWVVADGVGGNAHGDVASQLVAQTIERRVRQGSDLSAAIFEANEAMSVAISGQSDLEGMASTVVACRFDGHQFELAWVGDSRAYLLDDQGIYQLTSDHNLANSLFEQGIIEQSEVRGHAGQHELTQALGQLSLEKVPLSLGELHENDYLLLCTDGLTGALTDEQIYHAIMTSSSLEYAGERLLSQVLDAGAPDNVTFSLVIFQEDDRPIKASDFKSTSKSNFALSRSKLKGKPFFRDHRLPFDKQAYLNHCKSRPMLLSLILVSIATLIFFI